MDRKRETAIRLGVKVLAGLVALDIAEYVVAVTMDHVLIPMIVLALPQAWLILRFYMHVRQLRHAEET